MPERDWIITGRSGATAETNSVPRRSTNAAEMGAIPRHTTMTTEAVEVPHRAAGSRPSAQPKAAPAVLGTGRSARSAGDGRSAPYR